MARLTLPILAALWLLLATGSYVFANGGTVQLSNAPAGPYQISIFTSPSPIRIGTVDVSVLVQKLGTSETEQDAVVLVSVEPLGRPGRAETYEATHELATNKLYYAANADLPSEGKWRIETTVFGSLGEGTVAFEVEATRESILDRPLVLLGLIVLPVVLVLAWMVLHGRRGTAASP